MTERRKLLPTPYRSLWRTIWPNLQYKWYAFKHGVKNIFIFFWAVWHFDACDYTGLLELIEVAVRKMRDLHRDYGHTIDAPRVARQLTIVETLCRRLREDRYFQAAGYGDGTRWNTLTDFEQSRVAKHSVQMAKADAIYLGKMFRFIQHWWD